MEENIFEKTVVTTATEAIADDDIDLATGAPGTMYQINFGKEFTRVLFDRSIKVEIPNSSLKDDFKDLDYSTVISMIGDLKVMHLTEWQTKYFN